MPADFPKTLLALAEGVDARLHIGFQIYVSRAGLVLCDLAADEARPSVAMSRDTLMIWMSATKPVAAVAIAQLWERGLLDLDDPVSLHIPEFAVRGKIAVTIRQLLTHTAGFRGVAGNWEQQPWDQVIAAVCDARIEIGWMPGKKAGYHISTSWYILGEIVRRLDGRPFEQYVREAIFLPLRMLNCWIGMPRKFYLTYGDRIGLMHDTSVLPPRAELFWDTEAGATLCRPGGNGRGPARELARFYEMLLRKGTLEGVRILSPQTVEVITAPHRIGMYDHTFRHVMDWGLGFIVNSNRYGVDTVPYSFGPGTSPRAFGHGGSQSSIAFADPEHELVVVIILNGMPGEAKHHERMSGILMALWADLSVSG